MQVTKDHLLDAARVAVEFSAVIGAIVAAGSCVFVLGFMAARVVEVVFGV